MLGAGLYDGAGHGARVPLFAELENDIGKVFLTRGAHEIGHGRALPAHAHVERPVIAKGESALGLIELHRGDAEVEHDAIDRLVARHVLEFGEIRFDESQATLRLLDQIGAEQERGLIAINTETLPPARGSRENIRPRRTSRRYICRPL